MEEDGGYGLCKIQTTDMLVPALMLSGDGELQWKRHPLGHRVQLLKLAQGS